MGTRLLVPAGATILRGEGAKLGISRPWGHWANRRGWTPPPHPRGTQLTATLGGERGGDGYPSVQDASGNQLF